MVSVTDFTNKMRKLWQNDSCTLVDCGLAISGYIEIDQYFCLWMVGPLGVGKTTITAELLNNYGLRKDQCVSSPTFTLFNEYQLNGDWYGHLDLYRLQESAVDLEDLGVLDAHRYCGLIVEWPERAAMDPLISPTHILLLAFGERDDQRKLTLYGP